MVPAHNLTFVCCGTAHGGARFAGNVQLHFRQGFAARSRAPTGVWRSSRGWRSSCRACGIRAEGPVPSSASRAARCASICPRSRSRRACRTSRAHQLIVLAAAPPLLEARSGRSSRRAPLERMLAGTGLRAEFSRPDEAIIVAQPAAEQARRPTRRRMRPCRSTGSAIPAIGARSRACCRRMLIDALRAARGPCRAAIDSRRAGAHRQQGRWWRSTWWHRAVRPPATRR